MTFVLQELLLLLVHQPVLPEQELLLRRGNQRPLLLLPDSFQVGVDGVVAAVGAAADVQGGVGLPPLLVSHAPSCNVMFNAIFRK